MNLQYVVDSISDAADWQKQMTQNEVIFKVEDDLNLHIHNPGGDYIFLYAKLLKLPSDAYKAQEICQKIASYTLSTCKKMQSCICIDNGMLLNYLNLSDELEALEIVQKTNLFINEVVWWKTQLTRLNYL